VWKSTNAAETTADNVNWSAVTDDQATLSIGAIAIQCGNADPTKTMILAANVGDFQVSGPQSLTLGPGT
jgi:hypothetical protein